MGRARKNVLAFLVAALPCAAAAQAPPPIVQGAPETVYSEAQRQKDISAARWIVDNILRQSFSLDGQYARWTQPICPHVYGLTPVAAWQIEHRIKEIAQQIGAPVDRNDPCVTNIGIVFTNDQQATLRSIADKAPLLIQGGNQRLTVKAPVQAWYATFVSNGVDRYVDIPWEMMTPPLDGPPQIRVSGAEANRLATGLDTEMAAATVLIDTKAVTGKTVGELADYLALMTLSQTGQYGECLETASIANLMMNCAPEDKAQGLSHVDIALLTGLYQVPRSPQLLQKSRLMGIIRRSLEGSAAAD